MMMGGRPGSAVDELQGIRKTVVKRLGAGEGHPERNAARGRDQRRSLGGRAEDPRRATDLVFAGVVGPRFPTARPKAQALDVLRSKGQGGLADMLSGVDFTPGGSIDFGAVGTYC